MNKIDISLLKRFISYDPETGIFTWKENRKNVFIGSLAGNVDKFGYVTIPDTGSLECRSDCAECVGCEHFDTSYVDRIKKEGS